MEGLPLPSDYTAMQVVAVHAFLLTYGPQHVKQWEDEGMKHIWGPEVSMTPEDSDHLRPK